MSDRRRQQRRIGRRACAASDDTPRELDLGAHSPPSAHTRCHVRPLAASAPNCFGPSESQRHKQSTHRLGHAFVWSDQRKKVSQPWRGLANLRPLGRDIGQRVNENRKRFITGQPRCWSKYGVKPRIACRASDLLGSGTIVGHKVCLIHAKMGSSRRVGQVKDEKVNRYPTNAATHLERIDSVVNEMTKEFGPCALLTVGCVPNARFSGSVVAARAQGGVCTGCQRMPGGALVPITAGQSSARCAGNGVGKAHT